MADPFTSSRQDPSVDGLNIRSFEPFGDAAMQETTRTFFKAGWDGIWACVDAGRIRR